MIAARGRGRPPKEDYLSTQEAADYMMQRGHPRISARTVSRMCDDGRLRCVQAKPGSPRHILRDVVDDYLRLLLDKTDTPK